MQQPLQITFRHMGPSEFVEAAIRERVEKLDKFYNRITGCHVVVEAPHRHHHQGKLFRIAIDLTVPGAELVVGRYPRLKHSHEDVYVAIRDAFDAIRRRLEDYIRRHYNQTKPHEHRHEGKVAELYPQENYGLLKAQDGHEVYFYRNCVLNGGFEKLDIGSRVHFFESLEDQGPKASSVWPV